MKINKTFRLSPEAIEKLKQQDNPTQFIENLLLRGSTTTKLTESTINQMIDTKLQQLIADYDIKPKPSRGKYCPHGFIWGSDSCD